MELIPIVILLCGVCFVGAQGKKPWSKVDCVASLCFCKRYEVHCEMPADANSHGVTYYEYAEGQCAAQGGTLANLVDAQIDSLVRDFISNRGLDGPPCINKPSYGFFIGLGDAKREDKFVWSNGTPICRKGFTNWAPREPNNNTNRDTKGQDCVQLWYRFGHNGKWDDEYCNVRPKGFICEIPTHCCCSEAP
ncbi:perlucin-like protein [Ptychodera flava]|uniref:perlucin-like protein n=1 Tax=Ptychodera flava TaxID=63121 RepID=UPI003969E899